MHLPLGQKLKDVNYLNEKVKQKEKEFSVLQEKSMIKDDKKLNKKEDKLAIQLKKEVKSIQQVQQSNHILQDKKFNLNGLEELTAKSNINKNFVHQDTSISNISLLNYSKLEVDEMWEDGFEENFELGNNLSIEY